MDAAAVKRVQIGTDPAQKTAVADHVQPGAGGTQRPVRAHVVVPVLAIVNAGPVIMDDAGATAGHQGVKPPVVVGDAGGHGCGCCFCRKFRSPGRQDHRVAGQDVLDQGIAERGAARMAH